MRVDQFQARFDRALDPLIPDKSQPIALAVSGGGDSVALMYLIARSGAIDRQLVHVFTVDHGLRPEAAEEASTVKALSMQLGFEHKTLKWREPKPSQARARRARHELIAEAMRGCAAHLLLTGHTLSDNIESFLIRARAGSGWYGLSGMGALTASPVWPEGEGIFIARPMLEFERGGVREWLQSNGLGWSDDPSNANDKYERVRMRRLLENASHLETKIASIQAKLKQLRRARDFALAEQLGQAKIEGEALILPLRQSIPMEMLAQLIAFCAMAVSGTDRPPRTMKSQSAAKKFMAEPGKFTLTLGGTIIQKSASTLRFRPESNRRLAQDSVRIRSRLRHICTGLAGEGTGYGKFPVMSRNEPSFS